MRTAIAEAILLVSFAGAAASCESSGDEQPDGGIPIDATSGFVFEVTLGPEVLLAGGVTLNGASLPIDDAGAAVVEMTFDSWTQAVYASPFQFAVSSGSPATTEYITLIPDRCASILCNENACEIGDITAERVGIRRVDGGLQVGCYKCEGTAGSGEGCP